MDESAITTKLSIWLKNRGWVIVSIHYPGSTSSGVMIKDKNANGKKIKGSIIPDLIAFKDNLRLIVETRPYFSQPLLKKLSGIRYNDNYKESLMDILKVKVYEPSNLIVGKAIYYKSRLPRQLTLPDRFVLFLVSDEIRYRISADVEGDPFK